MTPQVMGVTLGSPYVHGVADTPHRDVRNIIKFRNKMW